MNQVQTPPNKHDHTHTQKKKISGMLVAVVLLALNEVIMYPLR